MIGSNVTFNEESEWKPVLSIATSELLNTVIIRWLRYDHHCWVAAPHKHPDTLCHSEKVSHVSSCFYLSHTNSCDSPTADEVLFPAACVCYDVCYNCHIMGQWICRL